MQTLHLKYLLNVLYYQIRFLLLKLHSPSIVLNARKAQHKGPQHLRYFGFDVRIVA